MQQVPAEPVPGRAAIFLASIDADLYRRGAAHHEPAPWPAAIEELLHSRVTRQVEDATGQPVGIKATADQGKSGRAQGRADGGEITARGGHAVAEGVARRGTQLDLAAGLERQAAVAGQAARRVKGGQALRDLLVRGWPGQVTRVTDQPLELDSYCARRSGLEAHAVHALLGIPLGQRRGAQVFVKKEMHHWIPGRCPAEPATTLPTIVRAQSFQGV